MNKLIVNISGCGLLLFVASSLLVAQRASLEIVNCPLFPIHLCVEDEGVRLPDNNQFYLGEEDPEATSCSVHVTQKINVSSDCGALSYEVQLFLFDTSSAFILQPMTTVEPDSSGTVELVFYTELSPDSVISQSGIPLNTGCLEFHKVKWIVTDTCGEETICEVQMNVYDCHAPEIQDTNDYYIAVIPISCYLTISAMDYHTGILDDCTPINDFLFSFDSLAYRPDSMLYQCELPAYGVPIHWAIWVADQGIDLDCNGEIDWDERLIHKKDINIVFNVVDTGCCEPPSDSTYFGNIRTEFGEGIEGVMANFTAPGYQFPTYVTSTNGTYQLYYVPGIDITITPEKNDNHRNGVSTLDLVKIQKHLLGRELFTTPFQYIAADANSSLTISAIDLIELRKLILGLYIELPSNSSWRFIAEETGFSDTLNPWSFKEFVVTNPYVDNKSLDFIGVKIGDINGTVQPNFASIEIRESLIPLPLRIADQAFSPGDIIDVPIRISSDQSLLGMQFTLATTGMEVVDILPGVIKINDQDFAVFDERMTFCWMDANSVDVSAGETLFTLRLRARKAGSLSTSLGISSKITSAEIYTSSEQAFEPELNFINSEETPDGHNITCAPNPWKGQIVISFYLGSPSDVQLSVFDMNGAPVKSYAESFTSGHQQMIVFEEDLSGAGLYFYKISSNDFEAVGKMLLIE